MTAATEEVREGNFLPKPQIVNPAAETRACARDSVTPSAAASPGAVTERVRRAGHAASRAVAVLDKPGTLAHSQPPTFKQAWDWHAECARHYESAALRWARYWWGVIHLLVVKTALNLAEWITEAPSRFLVAAIISIAIWLFA